MQCFFAPAEAFSGEEATMVALVLRFPQFRPILSRIFSADLESEIFRRLRLLADLEDSIEDTAAAQGDMTGQARDEALSVVTTVLQGVGNGVRLTKAGYLPPGLALEMGSEMQLRNFELSRGGESKMFKVAKFREAIQKTGLLRKYKGDLLLTKMGVRALSDPEVLWDHLAQRMGSSAGSKRDFSQEASLLSLLVAATSDGDLQLDLVAELLTASGWRLGDENVSSYDVVFAGAWPLIVLWYIGPPAQRDWFPSKVSAAAVHLARRAVTN